MDIIGESPNIPNCIYGAVLLKEHVSFSPFQYILSPGKNGCETGVSMNSIL